MLDRLSVAAAVGAATRPSTWFDLESSVDRARLQNPELVLGQLRGLVVLDEIQMVPELFGVLRVLADRPRTPARFLILGSASPSLVRGASESLAGRVEFVELGGFYWATHGGSELDLLFTHRGRRYGVEFKMSDSPVATRSMHVAIADLSLAHLWIVYPGQTSFPIDSRLSAWPLRDVAQLPRALTSRRR